MVDRADIDAVLEDANEQLIRVRELYDESLRDKEVPAKLKTRIKNVVESQRSALEYLAHAIYECHGDGKGARSYYPVAPTPTKFPDVFERVLPGVAANCPDAREAIKARQPYEPGFEWLRHLTLLTNENKHRRLTPQTRKETTTVETKGPRGGQVGYTEGVTFLPGGQGIALGPGGSISIGPGGSIEIGPGGTSVSGVPVDPRTQRPVPMLGATVAEIIYVDWLFDDPQLSALGTLERIQESLPSLVDDVISALP